MKSHHVDLLNEAIAPALTRLALPIMATSLVQMLYNLTDMAWIGRHGAGAVTAVGSAGMYTWFSQGFAILARTGGQVKTAHCLGAGENDSAAQYARGALQLGILFAVLYGLVSLFGASRLIGFFKLNSPEVIAQAEWYVRIACGLVIFSYLNAILTGLLTAAGNSRTPFIVNVAGLVFNVVLDPVLIFGIGPFPELGVSGAAAATVTAQALVSLLFFKAVLREKVLFPHLRLWVLVPVKVWREIVRIGVPSAVQNLIYAGISMILTRLITGWGDLAVAAQRVGSQIESVSWMVGDGFSAAVNAFLGQNYGAKRYDRVRLFLCDRDDGGVGTLHDIFADRNGASAVLDLFAGRRGHGDRRQLPADCGTEPDVYDGGTDLDRCVFRSGANAVSVDHQRDLYLRAHPSGGVVVLCDGT